MLFSNVYIADVVIQVQECDATMHNSSNTALAPKKSQLIINKFIQKTYSAAIFIPIKVDGMLVTLVGVQ
ncbi:MAG TPA: hypothetical protein VF610_06030 [Segetibacter sp.]|jgi:hypothetical protein